MRTNFSDLDIRFTIGDTRFQALNIIYERFLRTVPSHSHGSGSYEIHYIPRGYGRARINGRFYDIVPGKKAPLPALRRAAARRQGTGVVPV